MLLLLLFCVCDSGGRPASAQGHHQLNGSASGSRTLQDMQTELLRRTYRGVTAQSDELFTGLDAQHRATMPYSSTSHFLRQAHGFEKPKSADPPPSGVCRFKKKILYTMSKMSNPVCRLLESTPTIVIYYYYSTGKLILIYRPIEGRRLNRPVWLVTYQDGSSTRRYFQY